MNLFKNRNRLTDIETYGYQWGWWGVGGGLGGDKLGVWD